MKISIVTVTYNSAATLADTLRSVAAQSHPAIEHIVVDGGSTDATLEVLHEHGSHVAQWVSEPDEGIYDAMNKGLRAATGDFVGFLNADDMLAGSDTVAAIARAAAGAGVDAVFGDLVYVRRNRPDKVVRHWCSGQFDRRRLRFGWMPPHPTLYVRRSVFERLGGFDTRFRISADYDLMLRYLSHPSMGVAYVPEVLIRMRTGGASNQSLRALLRKSREDLLALRRNGSGGIVALLCKNARKLPQFLPRGT